MKTLLVSLCLVISVTTVSAQQASDYFPQQTGHIWNYKVTPLDSLNNEIDLLSYYRIDTFAITANYEGKLANIVPTKSGPLQTILFQPYLDSLFYHLSGSDGHEYFNVGGLSTFLVYLDSLEIATNFSFLGFFQSLENWYSVYKFANTVNIEYNIFTIDTSVTISSINIPLRFEYLGTRSQDESIQTEIGSFDCKKFFIEMAVSINIPPFPIEILSVEDYIWIAPDNWIVKDSMPSIVVDLEQLFGIPGFYVPGSNTKIIASITNVKDETIALDNFILYQNYPNPFNPSTKIEYRIQESGVVFLKVYDVLGNEVATLIDEEKSAGRYEVEFDAKGLSSGIYFYQLVAGNNVETKKMIFIK